MNTYTFFFLSFFLFQVTLTQTVYSRHFLLNLVEVSSASQVAPFLVDSLSSLDKNTLFCSFGCYIPLVLFLQCQMIPLTVPLESRCCRYKKCEHVWYLNYFLFPSGTVNVLKLSVSSVLAVSFQNCCDVTVLNLCT